jgi:uncharacterized protein
VIEISRHKIVVPSLPSAMRGLTVVQLTDLHRSQLTRDAHLQKALHAAMEIKPDLFVLTGDYVSDRPRDIAPVAEMLSHLKAAQGVYAILGNHDHHTGGPSVASALRNHGIEVLQNRSVKLPCGLRLVGLDDDRYRLTDINKSFEQVEDDEVVLTLAHNPALVDRLPDRRQTVLSGHTHGGQINVPVLTRGQLKRIGARHYKAGWYQVGSKSLYVCRGLGNVGVPVRLFANPEIAVFEYLSE